jgi:hypothetical protein
MIATGNHWDFDSLRDAPPARYRFSGVIIEYFVGNAR